MAPERDKRGPACSSCKRDIREKDEQLQCESVCGLLFHAKCAGINSKEYNMIVQLGSKVIWSCSGCRLGTYVPAATQFLNSMKETCNLTAKTLTERIDTLENTLKQSTGRLYADVAAMDAPGTNRGKHNPNYAELRDKKIKAFIIKPIKHQTNEETRREIQDVINPAETKTIIDSIKNINGGGIIIKTIENKKNRIISQKLS